MNRSTPDRCLIPLRTGIEGQGPVRASKIVRGERQAPVKTVSQSEVGFWDLLDAFGAVASELARIKDVDQLAEAALQLALDLTKSDVAFVGLVDAAGETSRVFS